jgi:hypothetical protein
MQLAFTSPASAVSAHNFPPDIPATPEAQRTVIPFKKPLLETPSPLISPFPFLINGTHSLLQSAYLS